MADHNRFNLRALLDSTNTPYAVADHPVHSVLLMQGEEAGTVMYIEEGTVTLAVSTDTGKAAICGVLPPGAFLGVGTLRGRRTHQSTATAMTRATIVEIATGHLEGLLRSQPALFDLFVEFVLSRHAHLEADLADQIINPCEQRLARTLMRLAVSASDMAGRRALPHISQEALAQIVGTTRSRVNALMGKFRRLGLLESENGVWFVHATLGRIARSPAGDPAMPGMPAGNLAAWRPITPSSTGLAVRRRYSPMCSR
jgi:CRP-like cAMP-binding protein